MLGKQQCTGDCTHTAAYVVKGLPPGVQAVLLTVLLGGLSLELIRILHVLCCRGVARIRVGRSREPDRGAGFAIRTAQLASGRGTELD
jgi:hypothetical protein